MSEKTRGQTLKEELFYKKKSAFEVKTPEELQQAKDYAVGYSAWLDKSKTEREAVEAGIELLEAAGYKPYSVGDPIKAGDRLYLNNRGKSLFAMHVGTDPIENGVRICAAHIDSPRLDLKQHPLFENDGFAYFKTHYYGGIRKYQWITIPLALHGVVTKADGETVKIRIGDEPGDPVLCISDLLPHLAKDQNGRPLGQAFTGEGLNVILGSSPFIEEDGKITPADEKSKLNIMILLNEKYGITESDFISAELSIVPAQNTVDVGLDRWLIGSYGHDDRVCSYPALTALMEAEESVHTNIAVLADKEEIGSVGVSGMQCVLLSDLIDELAKNLGGNPNVVRDRSKCLSADVTAAFDPNYPEVYEKRNSAIVHAGFDAKPGTLKAKFNVEGTALMPELCKTLSVPFKPVGSLVVAFSDEEMETVKELLERGVKNGVPGLEIYDREKLREVEPAISEEAKGALWAPTAGIVCPYELTIAAVENAVVNGVEFKRNFEVKSIDFDGNEFTVSDIKIAVLQNFQLSKILAQISDFNFVITHLCFSLFQS
ncbi:MAG: FAD-dependent oxidoreductase, partial [Clostridia bacterium]|nr:FAD-dependent oxidoreductase [Clostridia bacterium]